MKLFIERSRWARGTGFGKLIDSANGDRMCCLGFLGMACGATDTPGDYTGGLIPAFDDDGKAIRTSGIRDQTLPDYDQSFWPPWLFDTADVPTESLDPFESVMALLAYTNDNVALSERERESKIAEIMGRRGVEVTFVD